MSHTNPRPRTIVLASRNQGKLDEYRRMFEQLDLTVLALDEAGVADDVDLPEDSDTFEANALSKARALQEITGGWTLADDSGLAVDALGGAPGVYSARYAGVPESGAQRDRANLDKLLGELADVPAESRTARFVCVIVLIGPGETLITSRGTCEGRIVFEARGHNGFGYDPVFEPEGRDLTMAQLPMDAKNRISHRGHALRQMVAKIQADQNLSE